MKQLIVGLMLAVFAFSTYAQIEIDFVDFTNDSYGIQGQVPADWQDMGFGVYGRNASATDFTRLIIQAAPLPAATLLDALQSQLSVDEMPEASSQIEGTLTWDVRNLELEAQGLEIAITLATTEQEGKTYLVLLQTSAEESESLVESVFVPVVQSISPIVEDTEEVPYTVEEVTFENGDISLAGTLTLPEGEGVYPAVILISGSGASDRDESIAPLVTIKPFFDIADHLTRNGIAVLRYDDRGVGESTGSFQDATLEDLASDASAAVDFLAAREDIAAIGLAGHSEGGILAPMVASSNDQVAFVIGLAAPAVDMAEIMIQQNRRLFELYAEEEQVEAVVTAYQAVIDALSADEASLREAVAALIAAQSGTEPDDAMIDAGLAQFLAIQALGYFDTDVTAYWESVEQPILAIYGDLDVQVDSEQNVPALEAATASNDDVTIVVFPEMNHILQAAETGGVDEYGSLEQSVMPEVLETMTTWILERFGNAE